MDSGDEESRTALDEKGSRKTKGRPGRPKKRKFLGNRFAKAPGEDQQQPSTSTQTSKSREKLRRSGDLSVPVDENSAYCILNFVSVFTALSAMLKCKECDDDVKFTESNHRGLGFRIKVVCDKCEERFINSCPLIDGRAYEINRRIVFAFRLLGLGLAAIRTFCGLMDLHRPITSTFYETVVKKMKSVAETVAKASMARAVKEEVEMTKKPGNEEPEGIAVSGDGTWRKRGFSSLQGVSTLIGHFSGKVTDLVVKNSYCKVCEWWEQKSGTIEYEEWLDVHVSDCKANHEGSAGKMEEDAILEMFQRSQEIHNVKYLYYIGDGDSKTHRAVVEAKPYGDVVVRKKECVGHVQKRMGTRLRNVEKQNKGLGGRGKLTAALIDELSVYYGKAIRSHPESAVDMKNAIWATFLHKCSSDQNPQHEKCPAGEESWCKWQKAKAKGNLDTFKHQKPPLPPDVQQALKPVYTALSSDELLERCIGGFTQNSNESLNNKIWKLAPKTLFSGVETVEIAAYIAAGTFNEGSNTLLRMLEMLGITIGTRAQEYCEESDKRRMSAADVRAAESTKESRTAKRMKKKEVEDAARDAEGAVYGPGIDSD